MLRLALEPSGEAAVFVSGGSSPARCLEYLSAETLPWARVVVAPTDERCVPADHADSNERMIREHLFRAQAVSASFLRLQPCAVEQLRRQAAVALVGMGEDGHFASIFPDTRDSELLDPDAEPSCAVVETSASPLARVTASLSLLLCARLVVLLAFGRRKRVLIEHPRHLPVSHLLHQGRVPVEIFWAE